MLPKSPVSTAATWIYNQRTIGPVSLTWVLRICWIRTHLEIHEHSMFYKLSPIQKDLDQIWSCHKKKWSRSTKGHHLKKAPVHGHTATCYKFWHHFKAFIILNILYQSQKDPFCLIILYDICFISYMYVKPQSKKRQPFGTIFLCKQKGLITLITGCMFKKIARSGQGQTTD